MALGSNILRLQRKIRDFTSSFRKYEFNIKSKKNRLNLIKNQITNLSIKVKRKNYEVELLNGKYKNNGNGFGSYIVIDESKINNILLKKGDYILSDKLKILIKINGNIVYIIDEVQEKYQSNNVYISDIESQVLPNDTIVAFVEFDDKNMANPKEREIELSLNMKKTNITPSTDEDEDEIDENENNIAYNEDTGQYNFDQEVQDEIDELDGENYALPPQDYNIIADKTFKGNGEPWGDGPWYRGFTAYAKIPKSGTIIWNGVKDAYSSGGFLLLQARIYEFDINSNEFGQPKDKDTGSSTTSQLLYIDEKHWENHRNITDLQIGEHTKINNVEVDLSKHAGELYLVVYGDMTDIQTLRNIEFQYYIQD